MNKPMKQLCIVVIMLALAAMACDGVVRDTRPLIVLEVVATHTPTLNPTVTPYQTATRTATPIYIIITVVVTPTQTPTPTKAGLP